MFQKKNRPKLNRLDDLACIPIIKKYEFLRIFKDLKNINLCIL